VIFLPGNISIRVIKDKEEFEALKETWDSLLNKCEDRNIFLSWEWLFSWWTNYSDDRSLHVLLILKDEIPVGIAPFMLYEYRYHFIKYRVLENIGARNIDYGGIIFVGNKEEIVKAIIDYFVSFLEKDGYFIKISQLPEDTIFYQEFRKLLFEYRDKIIVNDTHFTSCPYLVIPESWEKYCASLKRKRRHNLKYSINKIHAQFDVEFISITPSDRLFEKYFNDFAAIHQKRWEQHKIGSLLSDKIVIEFYKNISHRFAYKNWLDFSIMKINNTVASVVFGFNFNKKYYYYTTTFDPQYDRYSLGQIHIAHIIKNSIKKEFEEIDFLKGDEIYKFFWTQTSRKNFEIILSKKCLFQGLRILMFKKFLRFHEITQRTFKENYYLYLKQKK
jgi:CelD/BcsL family acetyltransferase involved in cellulose biosynthesis